MELLQINQLPAELKAVISSKDLGVGQLLFAQHEVVDAIFILERGAIQLVSFVEDGRQVNHHSVKSGESFAELALFTDRYVCTAIAVEPSRVLVLPKQPLLEALRQHPDLAEAFMKLLAQRLYESKNLLDLRSMRSAKKRVLNYLQLHVENDATVILDRPLKNIADDLGLTPEALSRALKQLQKEGFINRKKRVITLHKEFIQLYFNHQIRQLG